MKKLVLSLIAFVFVSSSCSRDDASGVITPSSILIKKIVSVSNGNSTTTLYNYDGNKLTQIIFGNYILNFTYSANNIVKIERLDNNFLEFETFIEYDVQQRVSSELFVYYNLDYSEKTLYTYNNDNTVSFQKYFGDTFSQSNLGENGIIYNDSNNETYKVEQFIQGSLSNKIIWSYDNKNNPLKNVMGYNKQPLIFGKFFNNITTDNYDSNNEIITNSTFEYTYDSNEFPINCTQFFYEDNNLISTTQISYFYE